MAEQKYIKQLYEDGMSKSEIQQRTKLNYRTVCKYADKEDWNDDKQPNLDPESYPVLGKFIPIIDEWLEGDTRALGKQQHTAKRIYDRLREEAGYTGGYSSVKQYVRKKRFVLRQGLVGCLPLAHPMAVARSISENFNFQADFCNPASGNEKGNVENKVGYIRRNALVPIPTIISFDEFNKHLLEWCEKDAQRWHYQRDATIQSLWEEESTKLLTLPQLPYNVFRYEAFRVSKTGFVSIDTNKYGLSPELHDETVQAKIFYDKIEFYHDHALVASYCRSYGKNEELMDWTQYSRAT